MAISGFADKGESAILSIPVWAIDGRIGLALW